MTKLHIMTLNWNGENNLPSLVTSLEKAVVALEDVGVESRWLVRDNGSKDNSIGVISQFVKDHIIFGIDHNRDSFATGVNYLFKESNAQDDDLLLLLNNDIVIKESNSISKMVDLQRKTKADVVGCRLLFNDSNKLQHCGVIFGKRYNNLPYHYRAGEESDEASKKDRWFQAVTAACCLVTASAFRRIGGLDSRFLWAFDDVDMCLQIGATGGKIAYCGGTEIYHAESLSLRRNPVNKMFMKQNVELFRKKWTGKYEIDHDLYLSNPHYKEISVSQ